MDARHNLPTLEAYDPATNRWSTKASKPTPGSVAVGVVNGILYAVGGDTASTPASVCGCVNILEAYDPTTDRWTTKAPMPTARTGVGVGVVNGFLYAVGGQSLAVGFTSSWLGTLEAYDPTTDRWTTKAPMPTARTGVGVGVANGTLYAVGGQGPPVAPTYGWLRTLEAYDPTTDTWTTKAPMPTGRTGPGVGVVNGILYAVSGWNGGGVAAAPAYVLEAYDPATHAWTTKRPSWGATGMGVGVANGALYVVGGWSGGEFGRILSALRAYDPVTNTWPPNPWWPIAP
jgi:N-acetylneuraminic acid mutarotase